MPAENFTVELRISRQAAEALLAKAPPAELLAVHPDAAFGRAGLELANELRRVLMPETPEERAHRELHDGTRTYIRGGDDAAD